MKHLIIDTSYLIYRSYFAYPLLTSNGQNTGALYGFIKTVFSLVKEFEPDTLTFACDRPEKTWRHEILPEYKAGRPEIENQMREQIPKILEWCELVTPNVFATPGYEADDLIFTICLAESTGLQERVGQSATSSEHLFVSNTSPLAAEGRKTLFRVQGLPWGLIPTGAPRSGDSLTQSDLNHLSHFQNNHDQFYIFSSDRDLYQLLIQPNIQFVSQHKGQTSLFGLPQFYEKYQLEPRQWVDFKALVGDPSDNLKGVSGIGPKTATRILQEVDSLQLLFEVLEIESQITHLDGFTDQQRMRAGVFASDPKNQKLIDKIKADLKMIEQTYHLATLQKVYKIQLNPKSFNFHNSLEWLQNLNLQSLVRELSKNTAQSLVPLSQPDDNALF